MSEARSIGIEEFDQLVEYIKGETGEDEDDVRSKLMRASLTVFDNCTFQPPAADVP